MKEKEFNLNKKIENMKESELLELKRKIEKVLFELEKSGRISDLEFRIEKYKEMTFEDVEEMKEINEIGDAYTNR